MQRGELDLSTYSNFYFPSLLFLVISASLHFFYYKASRNMAVFFTLLKLFAFLDEFLFSLRIPRRLSTILVATNLRYCEPIDPSP